MRARIAIALSSYWVGIVYAIEMIAAIGALGAVGGLPALLNVVSRYTHVAMRWLQDLQSRPVRHL